MTYAPYTETLPLFSTSKEPRKLNLVSTKLSTPKLNKSIVVRSQLKIIKNTAKSH